MIRQEKLFPDTRPAVAEPPRSAARLRLVRPDELVEGWNEPFPPRRSWVVFHYYDRQGESLCEKRRFEGAPPKAHFQVDAPAEPHYRYVARDWLCKTCLTRLTAREMF